MKVPCKPLRVNLVARRACGARSPGILHRSEGQDVFLSMPVYRMDRAHNLTQALLGDNTLRSPTGGGMLLLACTILLEISGTLLLKRNEETMLIILAFICYFAGLSLFTVVLRTVPLSVAYTTWCACGTVGVTLGSAFFFGETVSIPRFMCIIGTIPLVACMYIF